MTTPLTGTITVNPNTRTATQIVYASYPPMSVLVVNTDLAGIIYLSESDAARVSDIASGNLVPLGPNGSVVLDGTRDFFAVTNSATPINVSVIAGGIATFLSLTQSLGALAISNIRSPNFNLANPLSSPTPSWGILQTGIAYFFGLVLSGGTITGPDYIIDPTGIYLYSGVPALGNLVGSWVPSAATTHDPKGNVINRDFSVYIGTGYVNINSAGGLGGNTAVVFHPGGITHETVNPQVYGASNNTGAVNEFEFLGLTSGAAGLDTAELQLLSARADNSVGAVYNFLIGGTVLSQLFKTVWNIGVPISCTLGTVANPTIITTDGWNNIILDANWSTLGGQPVPAYRMGIERRVHLDIAMQFNANIANTAVNAGNPLPTAYRPSTTQFLAGGAGAAGVSVGTNGVIVAGSAALVTTFCNVCASYPIDH